MQVQIDENTRRQRREIRHSTALTNGECDMDIFYEGICDKRRR